MVDHKIMIGLTIFGEYINLALAAAIIPDRLLERFVAIGLAVDSRDGETGFETCLEGRAVPH